MPNRHPAADGTHNFLLVFGIAAAALGLVLTGSGVLPSPLIARPVSGTGRYSRADARRAITDRGG